jgi:2-hydroxy-3-oxopropionate reductase
MAIVGFIGLGVMGRPMAKNLIRAGYKLVVYDKSAKFDDLISLGAEGAVSNKEVASKSEIIFTILPNTPQVKEAIIGAGGVIEGLKKGAIVVDMSSIAPDACREVGAVLAEKRAVFLDAPVSGGKASAIDGTLSIMAEGDKAAFEKVKPILEKMGSPVVLAGPLGAGKGNASSPQG